jgi:hypothetical protein
MQWCFAITSLKSLVGVLRSWSYKPQQFNTTRGEIDNVAWIQCRVFITQKFSTCSVPTDGPNGTKKNGCGLPSLEQSNKPYTGASYKHWRTWFIAAASVHSLMLTDPLVPWKPRPRPFKIYKAVTVAVEHHAGDGSPSYTP